MNGYPLLGIFWTTLWFFLLVAWMHVLIGIVAGDSLHNRYPARS